MSKINPLPPRLGHLLYRLIDLSDGDPAVKVSGAWWLLREQVLAKGS